MHVLLVEDDPRLQRVLRRLLEDDRHVVEVAPDAAGPPFPPKKPPRPLSRTRTLPPVVTALAVASVWAW